MPEVDAIIGTNEIDRIVAVCEGIDEPADRRSRRLTCITI